MASRHILLERCLPVAYVADDAVVARDGAFTVGWELVPPGRHSVTQERYDSMTSAFAAAFRSLPDWTMVHRQDICTMKAWHADGGCSFLGRCFVNHFEGREYMEHRQYIWFTSNPALRGRAGALKGALGGPESGIRYRSPDIGPLGDTLREFTLRCSEFVQAFAAAGGYAFRRITDADLEGCPGGPDGLLQEYLRWFGGPMDGTDIIQSDGTWLDRDSRRLFSHSISRTDDLPGEVSNTMAVRSLCSPSTEILLSASSPLVTDLPFPHTVNLYFLKPDREHVLHELDRRMRGMRAMSRGSAENTVHAEGLARFIDSIHSEGTAAVYTHMDVQSWGPREKEPAMRGAVGAALTSMGLSGKLDTVDTPRLWLAAMPGAEMEVGEDSLFLAELEQACCLCVGETFPRDFPGGTVLLCDRERLVPIRTDTQQAAYDAGLIENYNAFILGPSGSGKSFFTAWYVRTRFDAGQHVFIIDKGGSYEGLCALIREETGGADGVYLRWNEDSPFSFSPLGGCRSWGDGADGGSGMGFFVSLLKTIWTPKGGWDAASDAVLFRIITDFLGTLQEDADDPLFDDFLRFLRVMVRPRILREEGNAGPYLVGGVEVRASDFDIQGLCIALDPYGKDGRFGFLLNDPHPADLFSSRFVVFEADAVADADGTLYALSTFCIIGAFERKMRSDSDAFRLLFIEEAWQAIATDATADWLRGLWKTARKYHTSATVVTQQVSDIISSPVVRDAIIGNSPVKILLDQRGNAASFDDLSALLGLSPVEQALVQSVGRALPAEARRKEVFISLGGKRYGVYALEVSPEEALVYESDKVRKRPLLDLARRTGSIREAVRILSNNQHPYSETE